jgi:hypothetical protein
MESMAAITMSQSASIDSSLAASNSSDTSFLDKKDRLNVLHYEIPSSPDELYTIADRPASPSTKSRTDVKRKTTAPRFGHRNPYLQFLSPTSSSRSEVFSAGDPTITGEISPVTGESCASTNGTSEFSSSSISDHPSRTSRLSTAASLRRVSTEQTDPSLSLQAATRKPPEPSTTINSSLAADLRTDGNGKSAASREARIEPKTAIGAIPATRHEIIKVDRRCYVSTEMPTPTELSKRWAESYRPLLKEALQHSAIAKDDNEAAMALEFYMAGTSSKVLKPSILVTCCSSRTKKSLRSLLGELRWLKESGLQYFVRVDRSFGYRTQNSNYAVTGNPLPDIEARLSLNPVTLCGISARVSSVPVQVHDGEAVNFTIGGLIQVNEQYGYLTASHPFRPTLPKRQASASSTASSDGTSDIENSDSSSSVINASTLRFDDEVDARRSDVPFRQLEHQGLVSSFYIFKSPFVNFTMRYQSVNTDWAFILASASSPLRLNTIQIPGQSFPVSVRDVISIDNLCSGPVWIAAGSGLRCGILNTTPTSVFLGGHFHEVRMVTLDYCLGQYRHICLKSGLILQA